MLYFLSDFNESTFSKERSQSSVKGFFRKTKSGKTVAVRQYKRSFWKKVGLAATGLGTVGSGLLLASKLKGKKISLPSASKSIVATPKPKPVQLAVVLRGEQLGKLKENDILTKKQYDELISSASYFKTETPERMKKITKNLSLADEAINRESAGEVFVQLDIDDGEGILGKTLRLRLKSELPETATVKVSKISRMTDLNGLEVFTRI